MRNNYNSTGSRDPIWTQVTGDPEANFRISQERIQTSPNGRGNKRPSVKLSNDNLNDGGGNGGLMTNNNNGKRIGGGLTVFTAAIFIAGEMAGSGVLALPKAIVDSGWIGLVLLVVFCFNAGYGGTRLGACWDILEERYSEYRGRTRNPYALIAYRAYGRQSSVLVSSCIQITLFGAGTVYLLMASQIIHELLSDIFPSTTFCFWFLVIAAFLTPCMWLGSPKDFKLVGVGAILTTAIACVLFFTQMTMDGMNRELPARHKVHDFHDFFLAFGTLLFAFGGASTFPTIQNDMEDRERFSTSVTMAFIVILILYLPVSAAGYFVYGDIVSVNIALSLTRTSLVTCANVLMAVHLILAFLIVINPVCQELEEFAAVPSTYTWRRCLVRTCVIAVMVIIGETMPEFGRILALIGGSTITLLTFVFPPLFYMRLCDQKNPLWPERSIPAHVRVYLWELVVIGLVGGSASTYSAVVAMFSKDPLAKPCYWR